MYIHNVVEIHGIIYHTLVKDVCGMPSPERDRGDTQRGLQRPYYTMLCFTRILDFSCVFTRIFDTNMLLSKTQEKT